MTPLFVNRYYPASQVEVPDTEQQLKKRVSRRVHEDVINVLEELYHLGLSKQLQQLARPQWSQSLLSLGRIFLLVTLVYFWLYHSLYTNHQLFWLGTVFLPLLGFQQLALAKQMHDAAHQNLYHTRKPTRLTQAIGRLTGYKAAYLWNGIISDWLIAPLLLLQTQHYREEHTSHHAWLGHAGYDQEKLPGINSKQGFGFLEAYRQLLLSPRLMAGHLLAHLPQYKFRDWLRLSVVWAILVLGLYGLSNGYFALAVVIVWQGVRVLVYYPIRMVTELCDHYGLPVGGMVSYTRTMPGGWFAALFYPDNDRFHLAHHLFPKIPLARLKKAHQLLLRCPSYASGHHYLHFTDLLRDFKVG